MIEPQTHIYEFGNFRLDAAKRLLLNDAREIVPLMPKAFDTLLYLVRHNGKVIEKDELMREIWTDTIVEENNLTQNISILRRVFGEKPGEHRFIATVPGRGYKFVAKVVLSESPAASGGFSSEGEKNSFDNLESRISDFKFNSENESQHPNFKFQSESETRTSNLKSEINKEQKPQAETLLPAKISNPKSEIEYGLFHQQF